MTGEARALALRAIPLIDLTDLSDACRPDHVDALARRALALAVRPAALCIWPQFVSGAHALLAGSDIALATVVNFPHGADDIERVVEDMQQAIADGADEIDVVLPWRSFLAGRRDEARRMVEALAECLPADTHLKVILETGELREPSLIAAASRLAIEAGAHFIKTSTGKTAVSATPEAARLMLGCIRESGRPVGFKASGGLRTAADAALYLSIADEIMGADWATPRTFRFGASSLLDPLVAALGGDPET